LVSVIAAKFVQALHPAPQVVYPDRLVITVSSKSN
jgi:hypothetical protein